MKKCEEKRCGRTVARLTIVRFGDFDELGSDFIHSLVDSELYFVAVAT